MSVDSKAYSSCTMVTATDNWCDIVKQWDKSVQPRCRDPLQCLEGLEILPSIIGNENIWYLGNACPSTVITLKTINHSKSENTILLGVFYIVLTSGKIAGQSEIKSCIFNKCSIDP